MGSCDLLFLSAEVLLDYYFIDITTNQDLAVSSQEFVSVLFVFIKTT